MPRSLDPSSRLTMVLACDVDKPRETQPRFFARVLTYTPQHELAKLLESLRHGGPVSEKFPEILKGAMLCLSGWENMTSPTTGEPLLFSEEAVKQVLLLDEMIEIIVAISGGNKASVDDKKKSE